MTLSARDHFFEMLHHFKFGMLTSRGVLGALHARPMAIARLDDDGDLWLVSDINSEKVEEIVQDPRVSISMQAGQRFVAIHGEGEVVHDTALLQQMWHESWRAWLPTGANDPSLVLLRIRTTQGEFWDHEGLNRVRVVYDAARAYLTGNRSEPDPALQGKVGLTAAPAPH